MPALTGAAGTHLPHDQQLELTFHPPTPHPHAQPPPCSPNHPPAPPTPTLRTANKKVKLSFKLPYRVNFGQDICLVGSSDVLGNWDPRHGVGMQWSEGDVWQVDLEVSAG